MATTRRIPAPQQREVKLEEDDICACTVILLCGLPASGKSTLSRQIIELSSSHHPKFENTSVIHLEYDALEDELLEERRIKHPSSDEEDAHNDHQHHQIKTTRIEAWNETRSVALKEVERTIDEWRNRNKNVKPGNNNLPSNNNKKDLKDQNDSFSSLIILMDDNYHLRGMRKQIHRLLLKKIKPAIKFGIIWVDESVDVCLERNRQRTSTTRKIPDHTIIKMSKSFEPPRALWENNYIKVGTSPSSKDEYDENNGVVNYGDKMAKTKSSNLDEEKIVDFVTHCPMIIDLPQDTSQQQELDRLKIQSNQRHQFDKLLRSWVGQTAKFDKSLVRYANESRKGLIQQIKQHHHQENNGDEDGVKHHEIIQTESQLLDDFVEGIAAAAAASIKQSKDLKIDPDHMSKLKSFLLSTIG